MSTTKSLKLASLDSDEKTAPKDSKGRRENLKGLRFPRLPAIRTHVRAGRAPVVPCV